ncbi:hypothetical protein LINPERHAP1_LOCUS17626 [Linum perenne]
MSVLDSFYRVSASRFQVGKLPVCYKGVSLITGKQGAKECDMFLDKITQRITTWMAKKLTSSGKMQLVRSVTASICGYWMSIFFIPK